MRALMADELISKREIKTSKTVYVWRITEECNCVPIKRIR
jgi:hypothetical protein